MGRLIAIAVAVASCLLIWKSGALNSVLGESTSAAPKQDPGVSLQAAADAMQKLKSVHLTLNGTLLYSDVGEVKLTGTGDLVYPHKENFSLQLQYPNGSGSGFLAVNLRIEGGHQYVQVPSQSLTWKDVTGNLKNEVAPGMDPINNLELVHAVRASDNMGDITMDNIEVNHFSLSVDPGRYIDRLKSNPLSGLTPTDEAALANAGIQVEAWISPGDHYIHQMKIDMTAPQFTWTLTFHYSKFETGVPGSA
jgi:hypothetical protein